MREPVNREPFTLEGVLTAENLNAAWSKVPTNGGAAGVDGRDVASRRPHLQTPWGSIEADLLAGRYQPAPVRAVTLPKANGGERTLGIPIGLDRVIQQTLHRQLCPVWEPDFRAPSDGFRPGHSAQDAVRAAQGFITAGKGWVVDLDLKSYFDRVKPDKLMQLVGQKVRDKRVRRLIGD